MNLIALIVFCFAFSFSAQSETTPRHLFRPPSESIGLKAYEIELEGSYWATTSYYNYDGQKVEIDEGDSYSKMDGDVNLRYGYGRQLELRGLLRFRSHTSNQANNSYKNSGIESYGASLLYSFQNSKKTSYAIDLRFRSTSYANTDYTAATLPADEFPLGDSGQELSAGLHFGHRRNADHVLYASVFYNLPPNNLSSEINYDLNSTWVGTRVAFGVGVEGIYSLKGDKYSNARTEKPVQGRGATNLYNSINREWMRPYGQLYYAFDTWRLGFKVAQVISGVSTDAGALYSLNILWSSKGITKEDVKIGTFKEYVIDATVIKVSPRGRFVKIDQGLSSDVEKGQKFDLYQHNFLGKNLLVGSGVVYEVGSDFAIIKVVKKYRKIKIEKGFAARGF